MQWLLVVLIAAVFGYGHIWQDVAGAVMAGLFGLAFGAVYVLCDRKLLPAIATHMTANFIGVTQIYLHGI
jgi:membrane protease YdiL (CAAX protease family)